MTVRASNSVSNESATMEFVVEKPVVGLSINTSSEYVQVGDDVFFEAFVTSGTDVHFDWSFCDLESVADAGMFYQILNFIVSGCTFVVSIVHVQDGK